jgi:beta-RFAP synthase
MASSQCLLNIYSMASSQSQVSSSIFVNTFARLHLGFLDLNGSQGRRFGSLGLGLNAPDTLIELAIGKHLFSTPEEMAYVEKSKSKILAHANITDDVSIKVHREIPRHFGLGSGTQMALAVGEGLNQLFNLNLTPADITYITGRGQRSGIGMGTFVNGGLVLDGGRGANTKNPPIIMQQAVPKAWRVLLIFDHDHIGLHGAEETEAFARLDDASLEDTQKNCYEVLMRALPAIKENDLKAFGKAVSALQAYTGGYFAPAQGGQYASQKVSEVLQFLNNHGVTCIGQTSWGPTGFAIFESESIANDYLKQLKSTFEMPENSWLLCEARNAGAIINKGIKT